MPHFKKDKQTNYNGSLLSENYEPATLPKYGQDLSGFITGTYTALSEAFLARAYDAIVERLGKLIQLADRFTPGEVLDSYVQGQILHLRRHHEEEVAAHDLQIHRINQKKRVRQEELDRTIPEAQEKAEKLCEKILPLEDARGRFELVCGNRVLPIGILVTLAAMVLDFFINYGFLQDVILANRFMLVLAVIGLSLMSDASMCVLGMLISRTDKNEKPPLMMSIIMAALLSMFLVSVLAGIMIRFGSMPTTFGSLDLAGNIVPKEGGYSLAEYGATFVTSLVTTATGIISMVFSLDRDGYLAGVRRGYETELNKTKLSIEGMLNERIDLREAPDPRIRDVELRRAAEKNIDVLERTLKLHIRVLLTEHIGTADYMGYMSESAKKLMEDFDHDKANDHVGEEKDSEQNVFEMPFGKTGS